jgi:PAS domain S-box-containing protein
MHEKELTLTNLISNLPGMVYRCALDSKYTVEFMSEACSRITGYRPDDLIGNKTISFNDLILPEYRESIGKKWQKAMAEKSIFEEEYPIKTASGKIKWIWERRNCRHAKNGAPQYVEGYIEDITERKLAEYELIKLSQAIEQNPVSVFISDSSGLIEYVNPQFTKMTGYKASEIIGKSSDTLRSDKMSNKFYDNLWETITSGKIWSGEVLNKTKAGKLYWASKSVSPIIDEDGRITNFVSICEDITEKKKNETELIKAKEKAEESDRLKSAFLANLSHEIRTPMNGILGFAELLKEPDLSPENQQEFIQIIESNLQRLLGIINDLIDISRIEAGEATLKIKKTNINKMLQELQSVFQSEVKKKNIRVSCYCDLDEEESTIETDSTKLNQIVTKLLKNALKFTEEGSITYGYKRKESKLEFYVADTGPGISSEKKELIFERFMQADQGLTRKYEGAGLGLAISKAYVELLGGSIWVESELGKGSTFFFELPSSTHPTSLS